MRPSAEVHSNTGLRASSEYGAVEVGDPTEVKSGAVIGLDLGEGCKRGHDVVLNYECLTQYFFAFIKIFMVVNFFTCRYIG